MPDPYRISVLISGGGTTLKNLIEKNQSNELSVEIGLVISNNPDAAGLQFARDAGVETLVVNHRDYETVGEFSGAIFEHCRAAKIDLVVMGGFLRRVAIPADFVNRVINIHPSLIPAFSGKGNYGTRVHTAVIEYGCKISGCTVHFVDDHYDHGPIIAQVPVAVQSEDTPESLASRIFESECELYPKVINLMAAGKVNVTDRRVWVRG